MSKRLKIVMIEKGIRRFDLALHLKVDPSKISKIINGWIEPDQRLKMQIAEYLGVSIEKIWGKTGKNRNSSQANRIKGKSGNQPTGER